MNENTYVQGPAQNGMATMSGFMIGAIVGAGVALLLAPASGQETRHRLGETARRLGQDARHTMDRARGTLSELRQDARSALEAGRHAFQDGRQAHRNQSRQAAYTTEPGATGGAL